MVTSLHTYPTTWAPVATVFCLAWIVLGACAHNPARDPSEGPLLSDVQDPFDEIRFATMDCAAAAAANEIQLRNQHGPPFEWSFNIFRDARGYYPGAFFTDHHTYSVRVRISRTAIASGHNHIRPNERELSTWDRGENGVLRAQERALRFIPHYLAIPYARWLHVWEWQAPERRWVHRTASASC